MTSKTSAKFSTFFLFAVIGLFVVANLSVLKAQSNIDSLKGTEWAFVTPYPVNNMFLDCSFRFEDGGKVIKVCTAYTEGRNELRTDYDILPGPGLINNPNYGGSKTVYIPPVFKQREATGKYTIKGKTLIVEFSDTVERFTYCGKDDKDLLCPEKTNALPIPIHKISSVSKQNNSGIGKSTEASPNKATNSTSNNISSPLSLSEFQNSYYKPTPLTSNTISGTNPDHSTNSLNYSFIADSGVLTFNFVLKPSRDSYISGILLFVKDRNNKILAEKSVIAQRGRTEQASVSIDVPEKQAMLLRMTVSGGGSYEIRLNGSLTSTANSAASNNKYSTFIDSPIIGFWEYEDGCTSSRLTATSYCRSSFSYLPNGDVTSYYIISPRSEPDKIVMPQTTTHGNWKYTAVDKSSGVLEEFKDGKLVEKGSVKFLGKSQLQYTVIFSANSDMVGKDIVGKIYIWNKQ